jgi:mitochondrial import receptor subunit TOM70
MVRRLRKVGSLSDCLVVSAGLYVHRGLLNLQWKGDINGALKLLEKAIEVDEKCEFAYETLGTVEVQRGKPFI